MFIGSRIEDECKHQKERRGFGQSRISKLEYSEDLKIIPNSAIKI